MLEHDIVGWLVRLDEVILKQKRISLRLDHDILHGLKDAQHRPSVGPVGLALEVLPHPLAEIFCLTDVEHLILLVAVDVDSGRLGDHG